MVLYVAVVIDTDGSAFITKAEFDSLKNNFQAQINSYNTSLDSKIDGAIASYLSGIQLASEFSQVIPWGSSGVTFAKMPENARMAYLDPAMFYRPFQNSLVYSHIHLLTRPLYSTHDNTDEIQMFIESFPNAYAWFLLLEEQPEFVINKMRVPNNGAGYVVPHWIEEVQRYVPTDWATRNTGYYDMLPDNQSKKIFWWDASTSSAYVTKKQGNYMVAVGLGRMSVMPYTTMFNITRSTGAISLCKITLDDDWDAAWHNFNGEWGKNVNLLSNMRSSRSLGQVGDTPQWACPASDSTFNLTYTIASDSNAMLIEAKLAPTIETDNPLDVYKGGPLNEVDWVRNLDGYSGVWEFSLINKDNIVDTPYGSFDTMSLSGNNTLVGCGKTPYLHCGEVTLNENFGAAHFDPNTLWCKQNQNGWVESALQEWRIGHGPIASKISDLNTDGAFGGDIQFNPSLLASDSGSIYANSQCMTMTDGDYGYLPMLRIEPYESEKRKINDFYAPLYANETMSSYGKSYVDGACICKVSTNGNLTIKLKSTNNTTLYLNKNHFNACDEAGNISFTADGIDYPAGSGVPVVANETIAIVIKNVLVDDMYYVKPDSATTILFESAVITQDS